MKIKKNYVCDLVEVANGLSYEIFYPEPFIRRDYTQICRLVGREIPMGSTRTCFQGIVRTSTVVVARLPNHQIIGIGSLAPVDSLIHSGYHVEAIKIDDRYKNLGIPVNPIEEGIIRKLAWLSRELSLSPVTFSNGRTAMVFGRKK